MTSRIRTLIATYLPDRNLRVVAVLIFLAGAFLRFSDLEHRMPFGADQTWNAWTMKNILIEHSYPLVGMSPLVNADVIIGPAYFYLLVPFYSIFDMNPIAAGVFAASVGTISGVIMLIVATKLYNPLTGIIAFGIWMLSHYVILHDTIAWPVVLLPVISLGIFYFLYRTATRDEHAVIPLAALIGFAFHVHITAIFFVAILIASTPFLLYLQKHTTIILRALLACGVWFIPQAYVLLAQHKNASMATFLGGSTHGLHLRRILQLTPDGFLEISNVIGFSTPLFLNYFLVAVICAMWWKQHRNGKVLVYLTLLWFGVPIIIVSLYKGLVSNYLFTITRPIAILVIASALSFIMKQKSLFVRIPITLLALYWLGTQIVTWNTYKPSELSHVREKAYNTVKNREENLFNMSSGDSYLYWYYSEYKPLYPE